MGSGRGDSQLDAAKAKLLAQIESARRALEQVEARVASDPEGGTVRERRQIEIWKREIRWAQQKLENPGQDRSYRAGALARQIATLQHELRYLKDSPSRYSGDPDQRRRRLESVQHDLHVAMQQLGQPDQGGDPLLDIPPDRPRSDLMPPTPLRGRAVSLGSLLPTPPAALEEARKVPPPAREPASSPPVRSYPPRVDPPASVAGRPLKPRAPEVMRPTPKTPAVTAVQATVRSVPLERADPAEAALLDALDAAFLKAASKQVVEHKGRRYIRRFRLAPGPVKRWIASWDRVPD